MDIQPYPTFEPLERDHRALFDEAFRNSPPEISEFTFTNLYIYRDAYKLKVSALDGLIILLSEVDKLQRFFSPIGSGNVKDTIERILKDSGGIFIRLPETIKLLFEHDDRFKIEPDLDNADYLFKTNVLVSLPGRKFDGKRNLIKNFKSNYEYEYIKLDETNTQECLAFIDTWCSIKDCDNVRGLYNEKFAIRELLANLSAFNLIGGAIKVKGKTCAVAVGESLNPNTLVMHVLKADPGMVGLYQTINNEFLSHEGQSFEYVNLEQDLGVEGLRQAKLSYHPADMIKKYTLRLLI